MIKSIIIGLIILFVFRDILFMNELTRNREINLIKKYLKQLNINNYRQILDVGAGNGMLDKHLPGVEMVDIESKSPKIKVYDGSHLPYDNCQFNVAVCQYLFHHVPKQRELLKEVSRVAKYVIIFEDLPMTSITPLGHLFYFLHFLIFDPKMTFDCYKYCHNLDKWKEILSENYEVINFQTLAPSLLIQYQRVGFLLKSKNC